MKNYLCSIFGQTALVLLFLAGNNSMAIASCDRLSVVEVSDFGEALLRLRAYKLSARQLWQWLASPGQALISDLPYVDHQAP